MWSLADDKSIVIKKADKGSTVMTRDRDEAEKQLKDENVNKDVEFYEKILQDLVETSNKMFRSLKSSGKINEKQHVFYIWIKKHLYLLLKIHRRWHDCGTPNEKISEFFNIQLKPVMQKTRCYIKDSSDFIRKIKILTGIIEGAFLVTAMVSL